MEINWNFKHLEYFMINNIINNDSFYLIWRIKSVWRITTAASNKMQFQARAWTWRKEFCFAFVFFISQLSCTATLTENLGCGL